MRIKKSTLRKIGMAGLVVLVIAGTVVGVTLANQEVTISTTPIRTQWPVYFDVNGNGLYESTELVGPFDVYNGNAPFQFSWNPYPFASGANGSYHVTLWQNTTPLGAGSPNWVLRQDAHHWASNSNGTAFSMGPFAVETLCAYCPTKVVIEPETYVLFHEPVTDSYYYIYTPVPSALSGTGIANLEESEEFVFEMYVDLTEPEGHTCYDKWVAFCQSICSGNSLCLDACTSDYEFQKARGFCKNGLIILNGIAAID